MRPKDIGTAFESAVVKYLRDNGFGGAERRALAGTQDKGDILVCPGVIAECKGGTAAETASDGQILAWLRETEQERIHAGAEVGLLVVKRKRHGAGKADGWHVYMWANWYPRMPHAAVPIRFRLADAITILRADGYGDPLPEEGPST